MNCAICGYELRTEDAEDRIDVWPCPQCMADEYELGYTDGFNDQVDKYRKQGAGG